MFQAYKMKMVKTLTPVRSYIYKNCSVSFSREENGTLLVVSIAPHYDLTFPDTEELNGILSWFGINPDKPYETYQVRHKGDPFFGNTRYFVQPV